MMNNISFKGYDAAPLKRIYLEANTCSPFQKEMQKVGRQEKIEITPIPSRRRWIQDMKTVIEKDNKPFMLADTCPDPAFFLQILCKPCVLLISLLPARADQCHVSYKHFQSLPVLQFCMRERPRRQGCPPPPQRPALCRLR